MRTRSSLATLALVLALVLAAAQPAAAATLGGVTVPDRATAGGEELVLNGMGLRKAALVIKVYVGGLYLPERQTSAEKVLAADTPRIMVMKFLYGVSKDQMCDAWNDGLEANTPNASAELERQFETLCGWMEDIDDGEGAEFTYVPGSGSAVRVKGRDKGTIDGKAFADALLRCWIGPDPDPGEAFKEAVLGG